MGAMPGKFTIDGDALRVVGDLETGDLSAFESTAEQLIASTKGQILLDFSRVELMPSSFIGEIMSLRSRLARDGRGFTLEPSPVVRQLLQLTGMTSTINLED